MPIRKKGNVKIQTSPRGVQVKQTGYTFYSYDKNAAALYFQFREQDGQPTDLAKATVHLVMILDDDNGKKFIPGDDEIEVISAIQGAAKYVLPDNLLGYEGKVTSYVYLEFSDGSHTDEGHFTFEIKRSFITDMIPEAGDKYVKDFDDIKAEVQKTANSAIRDIDKALPEVEDKLEGIKSKVSEVDINDRNLLTGTSDEWEERTFSSWTSDYIHLHLKDVGLQPGDTFTYAVDIDNTIDEVNTDEVKNSITFRDSEDNRISEASTNKISGGKKERAISTAEIPEKTSQIRIAKFAKEEGKKQKTFAIRKRMLNRGTLAEPWAPAPEDVVLRSEIEQNYSNRNLLTGTSDEWEERTFSGWTSDYIHLHLKDVGLQPGDTFTYAVDIDNTRDEVNTDEVRSAITFRDSEDNQLGVTETNYISGGKKERAMSTAEIPEKTSVIRIEKFSKGEGKKQKTSAIRKCMLNCGTLAAPWTLALEEIGTKSELEKIKQAIINLGGEI